LNLGFVSQWRGDELRMKNKFPSWRGEAAVRPRCQGRRSMAFIEAQRRPLTEEADGSDAGFSQEGNLEEKRVLSGNLDGSVLVF
jgi:hypothetical protein